MGIYARHNDEWYNVYDGGKLGGLEGLGGWAKVTSVTGESGNRYTYTSDGFDWVAYEFTANGSFVVDDEDGLVEFLLVASASRHSGSSGAKGGGVLAGLEMVDANTTTTITVGKTRDTSIGEANGSTPSALTHADGEVLWAGDIGGWSNPYAGGNGGIQPDGGGIYNSIFGTKRGFGGGGTSLGHPYGVNPAVPNSGAASLDTAQSWPSGETQNQGVVGIRVPAANALATIPNTWGDL